MSGNKNSGGHNAKSIEQLKKEGTYRKDRHAGLETPAPPTGHPVPPKALKSEALEEWNRMVARLEKSKTLSLVDDAALFQYVELFAETEAIKADNVKLRKLSDDLKRTTRKLNGLELLEAIKKIVDLQYIISKHSTQLRQGHMALRQYLVEFGMTPSARSRVKIIAEKEKPQSKLISFTGGKAKSKPQSENQNA